MATENLSSKAVSNLGDNSYARNQSASNKAMDNLTGDIDNIIKQIDVAGEAYKTFKGTINKYWNGQDKDAYLRDVEATINSIVNDLKTIRKIISDAFTNDFNEFKKSQNNTYVSTTTK